MRARAFLFWMFLLSLALVRAPITAASEPEHVEAAHAQAAHEEGAGHDAHGEAKPALLDWDLGSAFWSIIVFVILLTVLRFTAWKPILAALNSREEFVRSSLADAKRDRDEAQKVLADYTARIEKARGEAGVIVDEGRRDAEEVRKRILAEAKAEADAAAARAKKEIEMARDDAIKRLHDQAIILATTVAGKIVRKELSAGDHRRLVDESLAEIGKMEH